MSTVPSNPVTPLPRADRRQSALDARIREAELRLIAREDDLRRRADQLGHRLHAAVQPQRLVVPAVGAGVALFALWALLRRKPLAASALGAAARSHAAPSAGRASELPWVRLLALAWPLLPSGWRARVSPTTAAMWVSLGLPLAERLLATTRHRPLPTVPQVDLARYAGTWFEIARLPEPFEAACEGQPSAHYTLAGASVAVLNRCPAQGGGERSIRGVAHVVPGSGNAKLKVTFAPAWLRWLPFVWADYWVLHLDADYQVAVVGHPNRRHLWVLARERSLPEPLLAEMKHFAAAGGFPVERLTVVQPALP